MSFPKLRLAALSIAVLASGTFAPVRFSAGSIAEAATAECTTCCPEKDALCVVCAEDCITKTNAYDRGGGSCTNDS